MGLYIAMETFKSLSLAEVRQYYEYLDLDLNLGLDLARVIGSQFGAILVR